MAQAGVAFIDFQGRFGGLQRQVNSHLRGVSKQVSGSWSQSITSGAGRALKTVSREAGALVSGVASAGGLGAALFGGAALKTGFARLTSIEDATVSLTTIMGSATDAGKLMDEVLKTVQGTPFNLDQFATAARNLVAFGVPANKVPGYLTAIGEAAAASGDGAEGVDRITEAFGRIAASGQVSLQEVWSISDAGVNALQILADHFGVGRDEMKDMISQGAVPAGEALDALAAGITDDLGGSMEGLRKTTRGALGGAAAAIARFGASALEPVMGRLPGLADRFSAALDNIGGGVGKLVGRLVDSPAVERFFDAIGRGLDRLAKADIGKIVKPLRGMGDLLAGAGGGLAAVMSSIGSGIPILGRFLPAISPITGVLVAIGANTPEVRKAFGDLLPVLADAGQEIMVALAPAFDTIGEVLAELTPVVAEVVGILAADFAGVVSALAPPLAAVASSLAGLIAAVPPPVLAAFVEALVGMVAVKRVAGPLKEFGGLAGGVISTTRAMAGIPGAVSQIAATQGVTKFRAFIEVMKSSFPRITKALHLMKLAILGHPLILLGAVVVAIGAAAYLAYKRFEPFRNVVDAVGRAIKTGALVAFEALADAFDFVVRNWKIFLSVFLPGVGLLIVHFDTIKSVAATVWRAVWGAIQTAWDFIRPILVGIGKAIWVLVRVAFALLAGPAVVAVVVLQAAFKLLWKVAQIVFRAVSTAIKWAWNNVIKPVFRALVAFVRNVLLPIFRTIRRVFEVVWQAVATAARFAWRNVIKPLWAALKAYINNVLLPIFRRIRAVFEAVWRAIRSAMSAAWDFIKGIWNRIRGFITDRLLPAFRGLRDKLKGIWDSVKRTTKKVWDGVVDVIKKAVRGAVRVANKLIDGLNWILRKLKIPEIPKIPVPFEGGGGGQKRPKVGLGRRLARGGTVPYDLAANGPFVTNGIRAIVGEGNPNHPEYVIPTDPKFRGRARMLWEQAGTQLLARGGRLDDSPQGGSFGQRGRRAPGQGGPKGPLAALSGPIGAAAAGFNETWKRLIKGLPIESVRQIMGGFRAKVYAWVTDKIRNTLSDTAGPGSTAGPGGGVERWRGVALQALRMAGQSPKWIGDLLRQMAHESGGNPRAINLWDPNATVRGTPSKGLMQTIDPTFNSWAGHLRGRGIYDPLANIYAAIRYTVGTYGSLGRWRAGGFKGYAAGGVLPFVHANSFDAGGTLRPGWNMVKNDTGGNEHLTPAGSGNVFNVEVNVPPGERDPWGYGNRVAKGFEDTLRRRRILVDARIS